MAAMTSRLVDYRVQGAVAWLQLTNPPLNCSTHEMMRDLDDAVLHARFADEVHVIVICGAGEEAFSAGSDVNMLNAVTGWGASMHELVLVAQRTLNLARLFNIREGFKASDDWLPQRFFEPQTAGYLSKTTVDKSELLAAIKTYYGMMGWNEEGVPRLETLQSLGIGWAIKK